jgi:hypothetical protein
MVAHAWDANPFRAYLGIFLNNMVAGPEAIRYIFSGIKRFFVA